MTEYPPKNQEPQNVYGSYAQAYGQGLPDHMEAPEKPQQLQVAVWVSYAAVLLGLVSTVLGVIFYREILELEQAYFAGLTEGSPSVYGPESAAVDADFMAQVETISLMVGAGFSLVFLLARALFTFFMSKGANWARIVLTVFAAFSLVGFLGIFGWFSAYFHWTMTLEVFAAVLGLTFLIVAWQGPVSDYMRKSKAYKAWQAQNPSA